MVTEILNTHNLMGAQLYTAIIEIQTFILQYCSARYWSRVYEVCQSVSFSHIKYMEHVQKEYAFDHSVNFKHVSLVDVRLGDRGLTLLGWLAHSHTLALFIWGLTLLGWLAHLHMLALLIWGLALLGWLAHSHKVE